MLKLVRRSAEKIVLLLDGQIIATICVGRIHRTTVDLIFDAPSEVKIFREEVLHKISKCNELTAWNLRVAEDSHVLA